MSGHTAVRPVPGELTADGRTDRVRLLDQVDGECTYFEGDGHALLGRGIRRHWLVPQADLRAGWDEAQRWLRAESGRSGRPAVAFVQLPFDRLEPATVHVPEELVWSGPTGWLAPPATATDPAGGPCGPSGVPPRAVTEAAHWEIRSLQSPGHWQAAVREAVDRINAGELDKVVLARQIAVYRDQPYHPGAVLRALATRLPGSYLYSFGGLVGASPELLVGRAGTELFTVPLAGTVARISEPEADAAVRARLLASTKLRHEHSVSRDEVLGVFGDICLDVRVADEPVVVSTGAVHHLASPITGTVGPDAPDLLTVAARMHPTSAVCGRPREVAYRLVRELEPRGRGGYCGAVGWLDANGDGRFLVAIRCVELSGGRAVIHVGNGIVGDSEPDDELAETRAKLRGLLEGVVMP